MYSPVNLLLKHSKTIASSLIHHRNGFVRFGSSEGNSNLVTKQIGKRELSENKDIPCIDFGYPHYELMEIEFEHEFTHGVKQQLVGVTVINGKEVKNIHGLFEFVNEKGELERGFFQLLKPKGKGKWKLLKAFSYDIFRN